MNHRASEVVGVLALLNLALPLLTYAQGGRGVAKVLFRDGVEIEVQDWWFKYEFGVKETREEQVPFMYYKQTKLSKDLHFETEATARGITTKTALSITREQIKCLSYKWDWEHLTGIVVEMTDGSQKSLNHDSLNPADSFLTYKGYPFAKTLALVGQVNSQGTQKAFSWVISLSYVRGNSKEQVDRICFE